MLLQAMRYGLTFLLPLMLGLASCGASSAGDSAATAAQKATLDRLALTDVATFDEPWAMAFVPGTPYLLVTEREGTIRIVDAAGKVFAVEGAPRVDYGGQGGLGDIAFLAGTGDSPLSPTIFLSWAEPGPGDTRGAVVGRGSLEIDEGDGTARINGLEIIWRQQPKVSGRGHYSHRLAFSPDGQYLFVSSGDRQKMAPAQDPASDLGKIIRIPIDIAGKPTGPAERFSMGHRNVLGLAFDSEGRLWDLEHGPAGGDEINLVEQGRNYGWPLVSEGRHYSGKAIPRHATRPDLAAPAISWNPVIAPGNMVIWQGGLFPQWQGNAIIAGMAYPGLVRVELRGTTAREVERIPLGSRIREVEQGPDGALWLLEDGDDGRLRRIAPK